VGGGGGGSNSSNSKREGRRAKCTFPSTQRWGEGKERKEKKAKGERFYIPVAKEAEREGGGSSWRALLWNENGKEVRTFRIHEDGVEFAKKKG